MKTADRIVRALLSLAVIPVAFFTDIIHWIYDLPLELFGSGDNGLTEDNFSLYEIYTQFIKGFNIDIREMLTGDSTNEALQTLIPHAKWVAVFFVLTIAIALASGIISLASDKKLPSFICGGLGIASLTGLKVCFDNMVSPILEGQVTLGGLFDVPMLGAIIDIEIINLSSAWIFMIMLFAGLILWSLSYILTNDKNKK